MSYLFPIRTMSFMVVSLGLGLWPCFFVILSPLSYLLSQPLGVSALHRLDPSVSARVLRITFCKFSECDQIDAKEGDPVHRAFVSLLPPACSSS